MFYNLRPKEGYHSSTLANEYRASKDVMIKRKYPFPQINTLFDPLLGATLFTKLVLSLGHHQLQAKSEVIPKKVIGTQYVLYECTFMSSELINASYMFMRHVKSIFKDYLDKFIMVHLNEVLIYSSLRMNMLNIFIWH